jgi:hypothetical protein
MLAQGVPATYSETQTPTGQTVRTFLDAGQNPPDGVVVTYYLREPPQAEVTLSFLDAQGQLIKRFSSQVMNEPPSAAGLKELRVPTEAGMNRFVWNMRYPDAQAVPGDVTTERSLTGPLAPPGSYQVQLTVGEQTYTASLEIRKDPRVAATQADLEAQFALLMRIRDKLSHTHDAINRLRSIRRQVEEWERRTEGLSDPGSASEAVAPAAKALKEKLSAVEEELIQPRARVQQDQLNFPTRLNAKLAGLTSVVASADAVPPQQAYEVFNDVSARIDQHLKRLQEVIDTDVTAFDKLIRTSDIPAIVPKSAIQNERGA